MSNNRFLTAISGYEDKDLRKELPANIFCGEQPLVSVWVNTYNHEKYVRDCLEGIVCQKTDFPFEVLIIDDASTDSTPQIILEYAERYPALIKPILGKSNWYSQQKNRYIEQLLPLSRGKYVTCCEGDDYWIYEGRMQALVSFLDTHPKHSVCAHAYQCKSEIKALEVTYPLVKRPRNFGVIETLVEPHLQFAAYMGRLDVLRLDKSIQEDYDRYGKNRFFDMRVYIAFLNAGKIHALPYYWSVYRVHPNGIWTQLRMAHTEDDYRYDYLAELSELYDKKFPDLVKLRKDFSEMQARLNKWTYARREGKPTKAIKHLISAFLHHPRLFTQIYYNRYIHS